APPVARDEPREAELRHRGREVVPDAALMIEELLGDDRAQRVAAPILRSGAAAAVSEESGERIGSARLQRTAEHIAFGWEVTGKNHVRTLRQTLGSPVPPDLGTPPGSSRPGFHRASERRRDPRRSGGSG